MTWEAWITDLTRYGAPFDPGIGTTSLSRHERMQAFHTT